VTAAVEAIAAAHGIGPGRVRELPGGVANRVYLMGDRLVLRVPRSAGYAGDLRKEAALLPRLGGIRTARLVAYGAEPVPHLVTTRLAGRDSPMDDHVLRQVGRELAKLHRVTSPPEVPDDAPAADPRELLDGLLADGWIDAEAGRWLARWFQRLGPPSPERVLIHGDVAPQNLMADAGEFTGFVDWGDAMRADPAVDFAKLRLADVPAALAGYREAGAPADDWEARVLWHHLVWALARIRDRAPRPGERHWSAPPAARLLDVLPALSTDPWRRLGSTAATGSPARSAASRRR
jgi:hygromycin-B 7''-O-kinase